MRAKQQGIQKSKEVEVSDKAESDKATKMEPERRLPFLAVQSVPSHDVETSAFTSLPTTPHRFQIQKPSFQNSLFQNYLFRDKRSNEAYLEGNASMTGETTAVPQPKRRKTTAGKSVPSYTSPVSMPATGEDVEDVATAMIDEPVTAPFSLQREPMKETELGTAKYPHIQNKYGVTLADVINLMGNSHDKGAYEAYKAVIEVMPNLQVERLLPLILAFGDALKDRDRAAKSTTAKKSTAPLARLAQAFGAEKQDMLQ